jgi:2-polyprenyl-6-methoxyphenol hydroxylase-like FAD-dependent oxidoreductase
MAKLLGNEAIVVGAGIAGLAMAAALAGKFAKVAVLDRDALAHEAKPRMGAGQGAHAHQLLKAGEESLERLLPGITQQFYEAGAVEMRVGRDIGVYDFGGWLAECDAGFSVTSLSRPAYEKILRERVAALPGVSVRGETDVRRLLVEDGMCVGVELEDGAKRQADLVVDATGMTGPLIRQLAQDGHAEYESEHVKINVAYTTGRFRRRAHAGPKGVYMLPAPPHKHFGFMLPIENDEWIISVGGRGGEAPPRDLEGFIAYTKEMPDSVVYDRIKDAEPVGELKTFRKGTASRRKVWEAKKWPERLLAAGDAMSSVNPTYGQGMTVAACAADALSEILAKRVESGAGLDGLPAEYHPAAAKFAGRAWSLSVNSDYVYPETEGERPANFAMSRALAATLRRLADEHVDFRILRYRLLHMIEPDNALREGPLAMRFFTALQGSMAPGS